MALPKPNFARFFESYNVYVASHRSALHMFLLSCPFSDLKNSAKQTLLFARFCVFNNKNINHIWSAFQEHCQNENRVAQFLQKNIYEKSGKILPYSMATSTSVIHSNHCLLLVDTLSVWQFFIPHTSQKPPLLLFPIRIPPSCPLVSP